MSEDVVSDPVVEPEVKQEVSPQAEDTTPKPDQVVDPSAEAKEEPNPLEPGGERFKQVWARAKSAEAEREAARQEAQREREERIRLEERLKAREESPSQQEPEYTWDQLEAAIAEGRITRQWAQDHREKVVAKRVAKEVLSKVESQTQTLQHTNTVQSEIDRYVMAIPEIKQTGSVERTKIEQEYNYLVGHLGYPPTIATQLAATRAALGSIDTVERTVQAKRSSTKEPFMETHSSARKPQPVAKRHIDGLDARTKAHYEKMIANGRYASWDEVEAELKWERPSLRAKARG